MVLGVLTFLLLSACTKHVSQNANIDASQVATDCRVVKHARGEACIPLNPQRIVTLDFNSFAAALALDVKPIATWITTEIESDFDYFQDIGNETEILRGLTGEPNLEKLVLLNPDLIIVISHPGFERIYKTLSQIAPTVILPWVEVLGDWKQQTRELARILQKTDSFTQKLDDYNQRIRELRQVLNKGKPIRASYMHVVTGRLWIARQQSFAGEILKDVGILNPLFEESGDIDFAVSEEDIPNIDSDVIFIAPLQKNDRFTIDSLLKKPLWSKLKAVQKNQVYIVDFSVWRGLNIYAAHEVIDDLYKYLVNTR